MNVKARLQRLENIPPRPIDWDKLTIEELTTIANSGGPSPIDFSTLADDTLIWIAQGGELSGLAAEHWKAKHPALAGELQQFEGAR